MNVSLIAYVISVAVPAFAFYLIFVLDMFGTGKGNTAAICMAWGVFGAFGLAYEINTLFVHRIGFQATSTRTAPFVEEILKALILLYFVQQPRFRYFVDGAVYGFAAGIGFAMSENILYVSNVPSDAALTLAVSRVLSATLMHATASAVIGISLGLSRRSSGLRRVMQPLLGFVFAIAVHLVYNNLLDRLEGGVLLLLVAIGIGIGGGTLIAIFINLGLDAEKRRFEDTLGIGSGISSAERKAIQGFGSEAIEGILEELELMFGRENGELIRQLLVTQANIGILKNNLRSPVSDRLRKAWQAEIDGLSAQMDAIRHQLGTYRMTLLRSLLPEDDSAVWTDFSSKVAEFDPNHVHSFDLFMVASELASTITPEELEKTSRHLKRISIFKNVDLSDLENLSRAITIRQFSHGEMLFDKGDTGDAMYLIDRGYIDIFMLDGVGNQNLLRTYQAGDVVGELALLDGQPRSARARANGPLKVMILQRQHFSMFIQSRPKVIVAVLQFLADRVRYTTNAVSGVIRPELLIQSPEQMSEDTSPLEVTPQSDAAEGRKSPLGLFGRMSAVLDEIEGKTSTESEN